MSTAIVPAGMSALFMAADAAITTDMLEPVLEGVKANIGVILPVGIGLFAICLGIRFIPRIFRMFSKG